MFIGIELNLLMLIFSGYFYPLSEINCIGLLSDSHMTYVTSKQKNLKGKTKMLKKLLKTNSSISLP